MKDGDIITASELEAIINTHGCGQYSVDGGHAEDYSSAAQLEMDGDETFLVHICYREPVRFILQDDTIRAWVTTGLRGNCDHGEWAA